MAEILSYSWSDELTDEIKKMEKLVSRYKFKDSLKILNTIKSQLKS